ncbi:TetR/AcrR family transcriptional regulator [Oxalobacteraceae bacterium A2-2]
MTNVTPTAEKILDCARTLIIRGGYNGFSYADIAKVVDIRNASIHHHFPAKSDLVRTLVQRYREQARDGLAAMEQHLQDPAACLRAYVDYWEACIADASAPLCVCAQLAAEIPVLPEDVAREVRAHFRTMSAWLASVLERGAGQQTLRLPAAPDVEAEIFLATVHGAMLSARAHGDASMFGAIVRPALHRFTS